MGQYSNIYILTSRSLRDCKGTWSVTFIPPVRDPGISSAVKKSSHFHTVTDGSLTCWLALFVSGAQGRLQGGTGGVLEGHPGPLPGDGAGVGWRLGGPEEKFLGREEEWVVVVKVLHWQSICSHQIKISLSLSIMQSANFFPFLGIIKY